MQEKERKQQRKKIQEEIEKKIRLNVVFALHIV